MVVKIVQKYAKICYAFDQSSILSNSIFHDTHFRWIIEELEPSEFPRNGFQLSCDVNIYLFECDNYASKNQMVYLMNCELK